MNKLHKKSKRIAVLIIVACAIVPLFSVPAFAQSITGVAEMDAGFTNLLNIFYGICKVGGILLGGFGLIQFGLSFSQHDSSQRINGAFMIAGGLVLWFVKEILELFGLKM